MGKRIYVDVDDGFDYEDALKVLSELEIINQDFIKGMGIEEI